MVHEAARREPRAQPPRQLVGQPPLAVAERGDVPLGRVAVVDGDEGRLAAHRQPDVVALEIAVDPRAERIDGRPLVVAVGLGDPRCLDNPLDAHREGRRLLDLVVLLLRVEGERAADRRRRRRPGGGGQRDVPLPGEQAAGGVEADPAGAGEIDLHPGVQIGDVLGDAGRPAVQRLHVGLELDRVARDEPRGVAEPAQELDLQPGEVAAGAVAAHQRLLGLEHPRLHPQVVAKPLGDVAVDVDQHVDVAAPRARVLAVHLLDERAEPRLGRRLDAVGRELPRQRGLVAEPVVLGVLLDEEVERVERDHLGDQIDLDGQLARRLVEDQPRLVVAEGILLPVEEVVLGRDAQRVGEDRRPAVRRGAQAHDVRLQRDLAVVAVAGGVGERDADGHGGADLTSPYGRSPSNPKSVFTGEAPDLGGVLADGRVAGEAARPRDVEERAPRPFARVAVDARRPRPRAAT